jgi:2-polyprenyl-3-methyl-5-hydroxy-6-metoxy-1,4-benzoquinol methylase
VTERSEQIRTRAFGQDARLSPVDRFGVWLSGRAIHRHVKRFDELQVGDFGCGYDARFMRTVLDDVTGAVLVDVALAPDLKTHPRVTAIEGSLPAALDDLPDESLDVVLCISALEHLSEPEDTVRSFRRLLRPEGVCLINVPSWRGKWFLEFSAFHLKLSPTGEMDDHKRYYDPRDLWPLLVDAGFKPSGITCRRHKFGLNTFAVCRAPGVNA